MGLFSFLGIGSKTKGYPSDNGDSSFYGIDSGILSLSGRKTPSDLYKSWVYACIRVISQEVSKTQLVLYKGDKYGKKEVVENSLAMALLKNPNPIMTKQTIFSRLQSHLELFGNEYWFISKNKNTPAFIIPIRPEIIKPLVAKNGMIEGYEVSAQGKVVYLAADEVIHFKNFNPASDYVGLSTLNAAQDAASTDLSARKYNQEFFDNGARPGVILTSKSSLDAKKKKEIIQQWNQLYSGTNKRYKTAIADGGLEISDFSMAQKDMEFMEQRKFSKEEILAIFGVPKLIIGMVDDVNRSTAEASLFVFARQTIEPKLRAIVDTLNSFYLPLFPSTDNQFFEFVSPVPKDKAALTEQYKAGIAGGWMTPNEVRAMEGLPPLVDGDQVYLPLNLNPYSKPKATKAIEMSQNPIESLIKTIKALEEKNIDVFEKKEVNLQKEVELLSPEKEKIGERKSAQEHKRLLKDENKYSKAAMTIFESQKKTVTKNTIEFLKGRKAIRLTKSEDEIDPEDIPELVDRKKEIAKMIALFTPLYLATLKNEADIASAFVGSSELVDIGSRAVQALVNKKVKKMSEETTDFTISEMRRILSEGLAEGEAIPELTKRIQAATAFDKARAEKIARTEVFRMKTEGEIEAWDKSGVVEGKIWFTALDERVCAACADLHGEEIPVRGTFLSLGDTDGLGRKIDFEPVVGSPEHPQCRCTLLPVISAKSFKKKKLSADDLIDIYNETKNER